jgi:hypothetical protein
VEVQLALLRVVHGAAAVAGGVPVVYRLVQVLPHAPSIERDLPGQVHSRAHSASLQTWMLPQVFLERAFPLERSNTKANAGRDL